MMMRDVVDMCMMLAEVGRAVPPEEWVDEIREEVESARIEAAWHSFASESE